MFEPTTTAADVLDQIRLLDFDFYKDGDDDLIFGHWDGRKLVPPPRTLLDAAAKFGPDILLVLGKLRRIP